MVLLFRLPFLLIELLLRRLFGRDDEEERVAPAAPPSPAAPAAAPGASANGAPPPPTAEEALERSWEREAEVAAEPAPPPTRLRPISDAGHLEVSDELVESFGPAADVGDVGGTITVEEPWAGYATQSAAAIVARLRGADAATKAVVALYERGHKQRATVLRATG
jgi:hypothetical protein